MAEQTAPASPAETTNAESWQKGDRPYSAETTEGLYPDFDNLHPEDFSIQVIDIGRVVKAESREAAETFLAEQTALGGLKGFAKKIWHGNIARDYYLQKYQQASKNEIIETGNIYAPFDIDASRSDMSVEYMLRRAQLGYLNETESADELGLLPGGAQIEAELKRLVMEYVQGEVSLELLAEKKDQLIDSFKKENGGKDSFYADNVLAVAGLSKSAHAAGYTVEDISAAITSNAAELDHDVASEFTPSGADKLFDKLYSTKAGSFFNETSLALAAGAAVAIGKVATQKAAAAVLATATFGVGVGVIAGLRERHRVGRERILMHRQRAQSAETASPKSYAKKMENIVLEMSNAGEIEVRLKETYSWLETAISAPDRFDTEKLRSARNLLVEAWYRIAGARAEKLDLIKYSSKSDASIERLMLELAFARTANAYRRAANLLPEEDKINLEFNSGGHYDREHPALKPIYDDASEKNEEFKKIRRRRSLKMAAIAGLSGLAVGAAMQETWAAADGSMRGIFEERQARQERASLLRGLMRGADIDIDAGTDNIFDEKGTSQEFLLRKDSNIHLPDGYELRGDSIYKTSGELVFGDIELNADGSLKTFSEDGLRNAGFSIETENKNIEGSRTVRVRERRPVSLTYQEYFRRNREKFTHIKRDRWFANNTAGIYEQNERRLIWGGRNGSGINRNGDFVFNVSAMSEIGSRYANTIGNAPGEIRAGQMTIALSPSTSMQSDVILIPVNSNGDAVIRADSFAGRSLFEDKGGRAQYRGAFAEAVAIGERSAGHTHVEIYATVEGSNNPARFQTERTITRQRMVPADIERQEIYLSRNTHDVQLNLNAEDTGDGLPVSPFVPVPIYGRFGIGPAEYPRNILGAAAEKRTKAERSNLESVAGPVSASRMPGEAESGILSKDDPDFPILHYYSNLDPGRKNRVDLILSQLSKQPQAAAPKAVVIIDGAYGDGDNEARKNKILSRYEKQAGLGKDEYEVVILEGPLHQRGNLAPAEEKGYTHSTAELKTRVISADEALTSVPLGELRRSLADAVVINLYNRGADLSQTAIVFNDLDTDASDVNYLSNLTNRTTGRTMAKTVIESIDLPQEAYRAYPELLAGTRFMQMLDGYLRRKDLNNSSSGTSFAFRADSYIDPRVSQGSNVEYMGGTKGLQFSESASSARTPVFALARSRHLAEKPGKALAAAINHSAQPYVEWRDQKLLDKINAQTHFAPFDFSDSDEVARLLTNVNEFINTTLHSTGILSSLSSSKRAGKTSADEIKKNIERILWMLGVRAVWSTDGIKIVDSGRLMEGLKRKLA